VRHAPQGRPSVHAGRRHPTRSAEVHAGYAKNKEHLPRRPDPRPRLTLSVCGRRQGRACVAGRTWKTAVIMKRGRAGPKRWTSGTTRVSAQDRPQGARNIRFRRTTDFTPISTSSSGQARDDDHRPSQHVGPVLKPQGGGEGGGGGPRPCPRWKNRRWPITAVCIASQADPPFDLGKDTK